MLKALQKLAFEPVAYPFYVILIRVPPFFKDLDQDQKQEFNFFNVHHSVLGQNVSGLFSVFFWVSSV